MILLVQGVLMNKSTITVDGQNSTWPKISSTALKGSMKRDERGWRRLVCDGDGTPCTALIQRDVR